jgi:hypothetical protein
VLALTLHQPWASLWAHHVKAYETRSWSPHELASTFGLPYPLAIHAGKNDREGREFFEGLPYLAERHSDISAGGRLATWLERYPIWDALPFGSVVGVHTQTQAIPTEQLIPRSSTPRPGLALEAVLGLFDPGRWAWETSDPRVLTRPIPARGRQKLWIWTPPRNLTDLLERT